MARKRILVADDEEGIRESLNLILGDSHDLVFSRDGQEALDRLQSERFDLALLDIKMPKMDGLEVLKRLQQKSPGTPILVLTAYQSVELAKEAIKLGAVDYVPKPFERERILSAVNELLAR